MRKALAAVISKSLSSFKPAVIALLAVTIVVADVTASLAAQYAAVVVDAKTGKTLYAKDANARRYPASLTKMMTLYMAFEALSKGKINKSTPVVFSANAAAEPPTKLGVRKGGSVTVETAILSMVTKSANDSATALGEYLGGSEQNFARMMTAKARALGMKSTVFRNAHGLPNPAQFTTAHDMAILGIALREHYPQYYGYFSQRSFMYGRQRINGHNRLLGRIKGVDGIKTGYTRASGYNLVSSISDGNRQLVAVVMGGASGARRDAQMAQLIKTYMPKASPRGDGPLVALAENNPVTALAKVLLPKNGAPTPDAKPEEELQVASADATIELPTRTKAAAVAPVPAPVVEAYAAAENPSVDPVSTASVAAAGWVVQVASSPSPSEAQSALDKTAKKAPTVLADAAGFTVPFAKGGVTFYRARFGGFESKDAAWNACNTLKKKKISCYAVQQ